LAEGIAFSPDGQSLYVANGGEQELTAYRLDGNKLVLVGSPVRLPAIPPQCAAACPEPGAWDAQFGKGGAASAVPQSDVRSKSATGQDEPDAPARLDIPNRLARGDPRD
jgi:DNA-binding beta-propeller fold protein YncE